MHMHCISLEQRRGLAWAVLDLRLFFLPRTGWLMGSGMAWMDMEGLVLQGPFAATSRGNHLRGSKQEARTDMPQRSG